jgi:hypothetical protein
VIYIYKNDRQSGPYEDHIVVEQLKSGVLSPDDLAIRHGETRWQPLSDLFPGVSSAPSPPRQQEEKFTPPLPPPRVERPAAVVAVPATEPIFRKTLLQKIFFGLAFLGILAAFIGSVVYFWSMMSSSGDLTADLRNMSFRILVRNAAIGLFIATAFSFLAFLLTFKRKIIASGVLRMALRVIFIFILLAGLIEFGVGLYSYFMYTKPYVASTKPGDQNELVKALEEGEAATGPYESAVMHLPISAGLVLLGLSGFLMTKRGKRADI